MTRRGAAGRLGGAYAGYRRDEYAAGRKLVPQLRAINSKTSNLLQLVDVLLGASTASASSPHKMGLQKHVRQRAGSRITEWTFKRSEE
jgi:hypothetical protein